ncbi:hypothetical protein HRbin30_00379 [bacterium HR30]|nr:hypothetical protein HRbin30_00379 [bacterium HR30]
MTKTGIAKELGKAAIQKLKSTAFASYWRGGSPFSPPQPVTARPGRGERESGVSPYRQCEDRKGPTAYRKVCPASVRTKVLAAKGNLETHPGAWPASSPPGNRQPERSSSSRGEPQVSPVRTDAAKLGCGQSTGGSKSRLGLHLPIARLPLVQPITDRFFPPAVSTPLEADKYLLTNSTNCRFVKGFARYPSHPASPAEWAKNSHT